MKIKVALTTHPTRNHTYARDGAAAPALAGTVSCDSYNGARNTCSADTRNGVALARQLSSAKCKKGVSWGIQDDNRIWVDQGCRGVFTPA